MNSVLSAFVYLVVGYFVNVLLTPSLFSIMLTSTAWANAWVYLYLMFWPFVLLIHFLFLFFIFGLVCVVIAAIAYGIKSLK